MNPHQSFFLALSFLAITGTCIAQNDSNQQSTDNVTTSQESNSLTSGKVFTYVDQMPEPSVHITSFLKEKLVYPKEAKAKNIEGRVVVKFIVDTAGQVQDVQIVKGIHPSLDSESVRVVRLFPKWKPGKQSGKAVNVYYSLPIHFQLEGQELMELVKPVNGKRFDYVNKIPAPSYNLEDYIQQNLKYPEHERGSIISGTVTIKCRINADGTISHPVVAASVYRSLDEEALRVVKTLPAWSPAIMNEQPVGVYMPIQVNFKLPLEDMEPDPSQQPSSGSPQFDPLAIGSQALKFVEQMPDPGFNVNQYLQKNLKYPRDANENNVQGRVIVMFLVDEEGNVIYVHTPNPIYASIDREARRVVSAMPRWKPGRQNGKPVKVYYTLPISFRLE